VQIGNLSSVRCGFSADVAGLVHGAFAVESYRREAMDEESAKVWVTVAAMKLLLGLLYTTVYRRTNFTADDVLAAHKKIRGMLDDQALVISADAALSDVLSDEVAREIDRFLRGVEKDFAGQTKAA
jgi:hypothetical protein